MFSIVNCPVFLMINYFASLLKLVEHNSFHLIDMVSIGEVSRFIVLAKEYFYYMFYHNMKDINVAHVWCLYEHLKW